MLQLSDSLEDYIEVIYYICRRKVSSRASEISAYMEVKMSSVTRALQSLAEKELINYSRYKSVLLTKAGTDYALDILARHQLAYEFLHFVLGLDSDAADVAAQKMKKSLSGDIRLKMQGFINHHRRQKAHKHADCKHNEMRCMLCDLPNMNRSKKKATKPANDSSEKGNTQPNKNRKLPIHT